MLSTTYSKFTELQVTLPVADSEATRDRPAEIVVSVASDGRYSIDGRPVDGSTVEVLTSVLRQLAAERKDPFIIISADATAAHQSVINVLDAARRAGLSKVTFAAQGNAGAAAAR